MKNVENKAICELESYTRNQRDKDSCFPWSNTLEGFIKTKLRKHDPEGWLEMLISEGILEEPCLGRLRFTYNGLKIGENMTEKNEKSSNEVKGEVSNKDTAAGTAASVDTKVTQEPSTKTDVGDGSEAGETITDVSDVLTSNSGSGVFSYPRLEEYLDGQNSKQGILREVELVNGQYGESVALKLDDTWFRSSSNTILGECKQLLEKNLFPYRVCVEKKHGKTGRVFHTLRGGTGE